MSYDHIFRWLFIAIFVTAFSMSGYFRHKARQSGEAIPRVREGKFSLLLRLFFAIPFYLTMLAYMVNLDWMTRYSVSLPIWVRWLGAAISISMLPVLYWVLSTLGKNISETFLTKENHILVTAGPYRWVRHPLYTAATIAFISLGILAANGVIIVMGFLIIAGISLVIIPKEEAQLIQKFGSEYREYMNRSGRLAPRFNLTSLRKRRRKDLRL